LFIPIRIPDLDPDFSPIPDPRSMGQKGTESQIPIRNSADLNPNMYDTSGRRKLWSSSRWLTG